MFEVEISQEEKYILIGALKLRIEKIKDTIEQKNYKKIDLPDELVKDLKRSKKATEELLIYFEQL